MAKLWNLPVVYLVENNVYGKGSLNTRVTANIKFYERGDLAPGMKGDG